MNIAVIFAGGVGQRMNTRALPKQFLEVHGKPVIIYTLEIFENHPEIDGIIIACVAEWMDYCRGLVEKFRISKVKEIVPGGASGQDSIRHGVEAAQKEFPGDSVVLIHDGVRPLIDEDTISHCIRSVCEKGSAITVSPAIETVFIKNGDGAEVGEIFRRVDCEMARAPQCFFLKDIYDAHQRAVREGRTDFLDSASLMKHYGTKLYTVPGPYENIKITTPSDFYIFRALLDARESRQILGV